MRVRRRPSARESCPSATSLRSAGRPLKARSPRDRRGRLPPHGGGGRGRAAGVSPMIASRSSPRRAPPSLPCPRDRLWGFGDLRVDGQFRHDGARLRDVGRREDRRLDDRVAPAAASRLSAARAAAGSRPGASVHASPRPSTRRARRRPRLPPSRGTIHSGARSARPAKSATRSRKTASSASRGTATTVQRRRDGCRHPVGRRREAAVPDAVLGGPVGVVPPAAKATERSAAATAARRAAPRRPLRARARARRTR